MYKAHGASRCHRLGAWTRHLPAVGIPAVGRLEGPLELSRYICNDPVFPDT